ncbi:dethiobiotin synthase [Ornithobacterium rhinotracheale]|uniref:ATP-dependent dethiobiotin synthetase BioD n=1 Tax=Ornithobacterium rhinotracheale (strain ATCC 51463 / DSM 15997 / CCUG 23171 / CIP 104009 / LMG 9086) TaxID=867902 RepID=I4A0L1_ORNRL|nr:dethiobiotin synthase [Ornithobacterium rhinotracheale]AFL97495.1 dethiobiotin synthase [Ornithobacterium rhinotracheale DSM 15997]AIP98966.1 ATP-dependent dethiobiotin synthetase BioD [Ornithobacterium rhinotracheale ORT-UMN 88]KGB66904.1 ATP-dependent dethiobiotin synthetase BioD [Ornithobacterium rhinotracheale H06-030791]MCK0195139.1 dethiobiotin synthase [Ornithobacterium rhinotracheale]UOH62611.1 dethiobiotin synthase [Ornithobacterium rhinotracheale]
MKNIFITGIDTDAGKTVAASIAVEALKADYWKPIQSGDLDNTDTMKVQRMVSNSETKFYPEAYRLNTPASPHAAAEIDGVIIDLDKIERPKTENNLIIEGAGGLLVPLNAKQNVADLIQPSDKVVLVTKHYLGSINHTLLSYEYLKNKGFNDIAIWINGEEKTSTEQALKNRVDAFFIERIQTLLEVNKESIQNEAQRISESLQYFVQK